MDGLLRCLSKNNLPTHFECLDLEDCTPNLDQIDDMPRIWSCEDVVESMNDLLSSHLFPYLLSFQLLLLTLQQF